MFFWHTIHIFVFSKSSISIAKIILRHETHTLAWDTITSVYDGVFIFLWSLKIKQRNQVGAVNFRIDPLMSPPGISKSLRSSANEHFSKALMETFLAWRSTFTSFHPDITSLGYYAILRIILDALRVSTKNPILGTKQPATQWTIYPNLDPEGYIIGFGREKLLSCRDPKKITSCYSFRPNPENPNSRIFQPSGFTVLSVRQVPLNGTS